MNVQTVSSTFYWWFFSTTLNRPSTANQISNNKMLLDPTAVLVGVLIIVVVFLFVRRNGNRDAEKRYPPSIPSLPLLGSIPFFTGGLDKMHIFLMQKTAQLGPVIRLNLAQRMAVTLNSKEAIVNAFEKHAETFGDKPNFWTEANILNRDMRGISFSHNDDARKHYHKLTLSIFKEFGFGVNQEMDFRVSQEVEGLITEIRKQNGRPFDPSFALMCSTANVVMTILFGSESQDGIKRSKLIEDANELLENLDIRIEYAPFIRFLPTFRKKIENMVTSQKRLFDKIELAIKHNMTNPSERNFITRFLEIEGPNYKHQDLIYILRDLCIGSSDTVGVTLSWALLELANHPNVRSRLQREIDEVCGGNRLPSIDDKPRLPYLEAVMCEVMRRRTLVFTTIPRQAMKDTEINGYFIPRGCLAFSNLYSVHMNPKVWEDPQTFRPERFLDKDNNVFRRNDIIPFGLGKRSCTGETLARHETFLFLASLVKHFDILPPDGQKSVTASDHHGIVVSPSAYEIRLIPRC